MRYITKSVIENKHNRQVQRSEAAALHVWLAMYEFTTKINGLQVRYQRCVVMVRHKCIAENWSFVCFQNWIATEVNDMMLIHTDSHMKECSP